MQSKILFLGTGGDSAVVGRMRRAAGGIIVHVDGFQFHIDPGPGALVKAKEYGINLRENTCILVSHGHLNHNSDLNAVISAMTYNGLDRKGVIIASKSVVEGTPGPRPISPVLATFFKNCVERVIMVHKGQKVGIESIEIHTLETYHNDETAIGFKMYTPSFTLAYSADTGYSPEFADQYENVDILILNCVHPGDVKSKYNLTAESVEKLIIKSKPRLCILTHFGNKFLDEDPIYQAREIQKKTGVQVIAAVDGLEIEPTSYAANAKQKTLSTYA